MEAVGWAINTSGQVSGRGSDYSSTLLWTPSNGIYTPLTLPDVNPPGSSEISYPGGLNDFGAVVGSVWDFYGGGARSFIWKPTTPNGSIGTLVSLGGGTGTSIELKSINASGEITGSRSGYGSNGTLLWKPFTPNGTTGTMYDIGALSPGASSHGNKINASGQVIGTSIIGTTQHAFLWTPNTPNGTTGSMIDLGDPYGGNYISHGNDMNNAGVVVGQGINQHGNMDSLYGDAFVWTAADGMQNLNDLVVNLPAGWKLDGATGINDSGLIVGWCHNGSLSGLGFLLTPTPEPASLGLLGLGILGVLARRQR